MSNGYGNFIWDDESILEMESSGGYTTLGIYLIALKCMLKMVKTVNIGIFMCVLPQVLKYCYLWLSLLLGKEILVN